MSWGFGSCFVNDGILVCTADSKIEPLSVEVQTDLICRDTDRVAVVVDTDADVIIDSAEIPRGTTGSCIVSALINQSDSIEGWLRAGGIILDGRAVA